MDLLTVRIKVLGVEGVNEVGGRWSGGGREGSRKEDAGC